jgi:putative IMPACT (imprinted ancient) family translation regulator
VLGPKRPRPVFEPHRDPGGVKVERAASHTLVVERSRFFAVLVPLSTPEGIEAVVRARRGEIRRANHHCWAYRIIGPDGSVLERSKDDGEVGHPGRVLLEILRRHEIEGAIVVSRIFGGVKLGVGGVSRAFREAGEAAVQAYRAASAAAAQPRGVRR